MIRSRLGLKALVLSGLVLGLMAFSASAAQAETGATWSVNSSTTLSAQFKIKEIENGSASLSFTTKGGTSVLIACTAAEFAEGGAMTANGGISPGKVLFKGCSTLLNEVAAPKCHPHSAGKGELSGEILSEKGKGLIVLDAGNDLTKITPEGTKFAVIEMGETCAIGETVNVEPREAGQGLWLADGGGNAGFTTEAATHLIKEGLEGLKALGQPAIIVGTGVITLAGAHEGLTWSGKPA